MIGNIVGLVDGVLDRIIPDRNARAAAREKLAEISRNGELDLLTGQMEINKVEAAHRSLFVAGWRPAVGWICALGLAYNVLISPLLSIYLVMPTVDPELLYPVMMGMLGLAGTRSYEKIRQVARER